MIDSALSVRFPAAMRSTLPTLPPRFAPGMVFGTGETVVWRPKLSIRRHGAGFDLPLLRLVEVRDTLPKELLRLDRSCRVFEFHYLSGQVAFAVLPDDLPTMWAVLKHS